MILDADWTFKALSLALNFAIIPAIAGIVKIGSKFSALDLKLAEKFVSHSQLDDRLKLESLIYSEKIKALAMIVGLKKDD